MQTADLDPGTKAPLGERELFITRVFDAPRELVFKAWTEPHRAVRWWGPQGFTTAHCEMDTQPGGVYRVCMRSPEGTEHWQRGVCREVPSRNGSSLRSRGRMRRADPDTKQS
jgi:uncharacterized protein YndB with AHSA1/START domain